MSLKLLSIFNIVLLEVIDRFAFDVFSKSYISFILFSNLTSIYLRKRLVIWCGNDVLFEMKIFYKSQAGVNDNMSLKSSKYFQIFETAFNDRFKFMM